MKTTKSKIALTLTTVFGTEAQTNSASKNTIVIVHGAWSSASDWDAVAAKLESEGNDVTVVNLPGHGKDDTQVSTLTLQTYVDLVKKTIGTKTDVTLVGHSFGGIITSQVAE